MSALVMSFHDGINQVAKQLCTAARDEKSSVLLISRFTGVPRDLYDVLIVNP